MNRVQAVQDAYKNMPELRETKVNGRMPWSEYRENITYLLPRDDGMYALSKVLTLSRETSETALSFASRLDRGRQEVSKKMGGNNLSDECYVEMLLGALLRPEKTELIKAQVERMKEGVHEEGESVLVQYEAEGASPAPYMYRARLTSWGHDRICQYITRTLSKSYVHSHA